MHEADTVASVIVAGSRTFRDRNFIYDNLDRVLEFVGDEQTTIKIISGGSQGPDDIAIDYAIHCGHEYEVYEADWKSHGRVAGPIRNSEMAEHGDILIAFWDGKSRGTMDMIEKARQKGLVTNVIRVDKDINPLF